MDKLNEYFEHALGFAHRLHQKQVRKGSGVPYISHLLAVAGLVLEHGGTEKEAIAALLHDAAEDQGGEKTLAMILELYGSEVAAIVRECSDSLEQDPSKKLPWKERKLEYLKHLSTKSQSAKLVTAADKLHNARTIFADLRLHGPEVWERFQGKREGMLWYLDAVAKELSRDSEGSRQDPLLWELDEVVERLEQGRAYPFFSDEYKAPPAR